jgi:CheY-like chemotaxis protein
MLINSRLGDVRVSLFESPEEALDFLKFHWIDDPSPTILFLDINMPTISGWEFMEEYEKLDKGIKKFLRVYILSSSVDQRDMNKAKTFPDIRGYYTKPLDGETILYLAKLETGEAL